MARVTATNRADDAGDEVEDPIHEEVRRVMADPRVKARLDEAEESDRRGERLARLSHNEARRIVGLGPLPGWDGSGAPPTSDDGGPSRSRRYHVDMARHRADDGDEIEDPIHEEVRRVMADPRVKARLDEWEGRERRGDFPAPVPDNLVRKIVGLPPLPEPD